MFCIFFKVLIKFTFVLIVACLVKQCITLDFHYHNYSQMSEFLHTITNQHPEKSVLYEIGKSARGKNRHDMPFIFDFTSFNKRSLMI